MILDKKLNASLDQGRGLLIMMPPVKTHEAAMKAVETIDLLNEVVDALKTRADVYNAKLQEMFSVCLKWQGNESNDRSLGFHTSYFYRQGKFFILYGDYHSRGLTISLGPDR